MKRTQDKAFEVGAGRQSKSDGGLGGITSSDLNCLHRIECSCPVHIRAMIAKHAPRRPK